jgi:hypothetical protein
MADDQSKYNVNIGLNVEGGESAAKSIANLTRQIGGLEKDAEKLRKASNALTDVFSSGKASYESAKGLKTQREQAQALKPAIEGIREALKGMPQDALKALGIDSKAITAGGKSLEAFDALAKRLGSARKQMIETAGTAGGKATALTSERAALLAESRAVEKIRERVARKAVESDQATAAQRTQVTMANAQKQIATAKQAATQIQQVEASVARQAVSSFGRDVSPMRRPGGTFAPVASQVVSAAKTAAIDPAGAERSISGLAAAANEAAIALRNLPKTLASTATASKKELADLHRNMRVSEATVYPRGAYARRSSGGGGGGTNTPIGVAPAYDSVAKAADGAARSISGVRREQDAIIGQVKNVVGMAFGYQALQAVAGELNQVFGHLKSGIIQFNSMIESTTVGFTTLFKNQAKQAYAAGESLDENKIKIDYLQMGYTDAASAAEGMIKTVREFANVTPFRFAELQESALRMRAFGFELDEVLRKNPETGEFEGGIVAVGNAVSSLGGGADAFRRITYALGQMKQAGRVYQNDMMQLANAGIGGYRYIADSLKKEISENADGTMKIMSAEDKRLFAQLEDNAIETVRRLTTNGQISGEAAARAILNGLTEDFGGGMEAQAKTFVGAFSTVADMSQSLVADAFKPLYDSIRDTTVAFSEFLQLPAVKKAFDQFAETVEDVVAGLGGIGDTVTDIAQRSFADLTRAIGSVSDKTNSLGNVFQATFGSIASGIAAIGELLRNDYSRALIVAAAAAKTLLAFGTSNPFLSQIILAISLLGILKTAVDQNINGIGDAFTSLKEEAEPFVAILRDELIPLFGEVANSFLSTVVGVMITGLKAVEPALTMILKLLTAFFKLLAEFKGPIAALGTVLAAGFIGSKILAGIKSLSTMITGLIFKFEQLAVKARLARIAMDVPPGKRLAYQTNTRQVFDKKTGQMVDQRYLTGAYRTENIPKTKAGVRQAGQIPEADGGKLARVTGSIGLFAVIAAQITQAVGLPEEIADVATNIGSSLLMFSMLKSIVPAGTFGAIKTGLTQIFLALKRYAMMGLAPIASGLSRVARAIKGLAVASGVAGGLQRLQKALMGYTFVATAAGAIGTAMTGLGAALAAVAVPIAALLAAVGLAFGLSNLAKGAERDSVKENAARAGKTYSDEEANRIARVGRLAAMGQDVFNPKLVSPEDLALFKEYYALVNELFSATKKEDSMIAFREGERNMGGVAAKAEETGDHFTTVNEQMKLLVNAQKSAETNQERLNGLLEIARRNLSGATDLMEELANSVLEDMLNPESRTNPYTGIEELGLTLEQQLEIEKELGFTEFENAQGRTKSFEEYRDLLDSIRPLTEDETAAGEINLKQVKERLKVETERRKEQEQINRLAEVEYDLGLATLQQYDESIDPLQRAVNLRQAQKKYTQDISDIQFEGLQGIISEAEASDDFARATAATAKRLKDLKKGQELILNEMRRMFADYNSDIADIMANPNLSSAQKKNAVEERLALLTSELESQFGITEVMLNDKMGEFNSQMEGVLDVLNLEGEDLTVSWGQGLVNGLEAGGFGVLRNYMELQLGKVISLAARIKAAADVSDDLASGAANSADTLADKLEERLNNAIRAGKLGPTAQINFRREISNLRKLTDIEAIVNKFNSMSGKLKAIGFASGGVMPANRLALVGEKGPELVLPERRGLVLNNSISSRLMGMVNGGGSGGSGGNNVTINVNNPVIRSENDIRKLATEISRVQASQFRTQGGRL